MPPYIRTKPWGRIFNEEYDPNKKRNYFDIKNPAIKKEQASGLRCENYTPSIWERIKTKINL